MITLLGLQKAQCLKDVSIFLLLAWSILVLYNRYYFKSSPIARKGCKLSHWTLYSVQIKPWRNALNRFLLSSKISSVRILRIVNSLPHTDPTWKPCNTFIPEIYKHVELSRELLSSWTRIRQHLKEHFVLRRFKLQAKTNKMDMPTACNASADREFGPGVQSGVQFDFTLTFEQSIFGIGK